jgi:uncharacterized protein (TIGR00297 family)
MKIWPLFIPQMDSLQLLAGFALSLVIALISYRFKAVSRSGAWGTMTVGTIIFGLGGMIFAIPLLFFFISSSVLSAIKTKGKVKALNAVNKSGPRDIWQVFANGGIATIAVIIYFLTGSIIWFFAFLASLCEATSDTWATEIGTLYGCPPISIITFQRVDPGQSGGITLLGMMGAIGGSLVTMLVAWRTSSLAHGLSLLNANIWFMAANTGLVGSLLDSVLGGSIQAQYRCPNCNRLVERKTHCGGPTSHIRGWKFMGNDLVNFACASFAAIVAAVIVLFGT